MAKRPLPPARARARWTDAETAALIGAWAPLYRRRRTGESDILVGRARSSRALVSEGWRDVVSAVNKYRDNAGLGSSVRTHGQCKRRVRTLRGVYRKELMSAKSRSGGWRFFDALHAVWGGEAWSRALTGRGAAATAADAHGGVAKKEEGAAAGYAHGGVVADEGGNARSAAAAVDLLLLLGGRIPKRPRTGASTSAGADGASLVKEELMQQAAIARAAAADEGCRGNARGGGGVLADDFLASLASGALASSTVLAAAVMKVAEMCDHVVVKALEVELAMARSGS